MARGLLYTASFDSDKYCHYNRIEIWEEGYTGSSTVKALGGAPILKKERGDGGVYGTSLDLLLQSDLNSELVRLYTSDNKQFLVKLFRDNNLYWQGFILPERYTEPSIAPPYDVAITATDGLGVLKNMNFTLTGRHTILEVLKYCLDKTGLNLDFEIICNLQETSQDISKSVLSQVGTDVRQWADNTCYEVLGKICSSLRMFITERRGMWRVARFADIESPSMIYSNTLVYQYSAPNPVSNLGNTSEEIYPIDSLTREILPAYKSCTFTRTFIKKDSFFNNPSFKLLENWVAAGNVETEYDNGVHYAVLEGTADGQGLSQTIAVDASDRAFTFELSYFHKYQAPFKFFVEFKLTSGTTDYYLTPSGWSTAKGDSFQFDVDITSITYEEKDTVRAYYKVYGEINKTTQETGEISFEGFPASGNLTVSISFIGSETMPNGHRRGKLYITSANLTTETPKGLEVKTLLSSGSEAASDTEIFFGDTETVDNSDHQIFNNLKYLNGTYTSSWKIGPDGIPNSFFNTVIKDYVCQLGLVKTSLTGTIQSRNLDSISIMRETFTGTMFFIDTYGYNLLTDEAEVSLIELVPYLEIASIVSAEVDETNPEVIIDYVRGTDGILRKTYTVASAGTTYIRGAGSTLQDLNNNKAEGLKKISNFAKALAAMAQQRADNANIKALAAAESSTDALLRLNNIVSNKIVSIEEKTGLKELMSRLVAEMALYDKGSANFGADITALKAAYDALNTFLTDTVHIGNDVSTELTDEQIVSYNSLFAEFYAKRSVFTTDISKVRAELIVFRNRVVSIQEEYNKVVSQYGNVYNDVALTGVYKTNLKTAWDNFYGIYTTYRDYLISIVADNLITAEERTQVDTYQNSYTNALYSFDYNIQAAKRCITDNMAKTLSDISNDNVLVPFEKKIALKEWQIIQGEKNTLKAQADTHSVSTTDYIAAYNSLSEYITPLLANLSANSDISGDVFRSKFTSYYDKKTLLLKAITDAAEAVVLYSVRPSVDIIQMSRAGAVTPVTISCAKLKQVGSSAPAVTPDKVLKYQISGGLLTAYSSTLTILPNWTYIDFILYDTDETTVLDKKRVTVVSDGPTGPTQRGPSEWAERLAYLSGTGTERFVDMVHYKVNDKWYYCKVSHTSSTDILPTNNAYWIESTVFDFVATKVLFANRAIIENAVVRYLQTADSLTTQRIEVFSNVMSVFNSLGALCMSVHGGEMSDTQDSVSADPTNGEFTPEAVLSGESGGSGSQILATFEVTAGNNNTFIPAISLQASANGNESRAGSCAINVTLMLDGDVIDSLFVSNINGSQYLNKNVPSFNRVLSIGQHQLAMYYEYSYDWEPAHDDSLQVSAYATFDNAARVTVSYINKFVEMCGDGVRIKLSSSMYVEFSFGSNALNIVFRNGNYALKIASDGFYKMINGADWVRTNL